MPVATIFRGNNKDAWAHQFFWHQPSGPAHLKNGMEFLVILNMETLLAIIVLSSCIRLSRLGFWGGGSSLVFFLLFVCFCGISLVIQGLLACPIYRLCNIWLPPPLNEKRVNGPIEKKNVSTGRVLRFESILWLQTHGLMVMYRLSAKLYLHCHCGRLHILTVCS